MKYHIALPLCISALIIKINDNTSTNHGKNPSVDKPLKSLINLAQCVIKVEKKISEWKSLIYDSR